MSKGTTPPQSSSRWGGPAPAYILFVFWHLTPDSKIMDPPLATDA